MKLPSKNELVLGMVLAWFIIYMIYMYAFPVYDGGTVPRPVANILANLEQELCPNENENPKRKFRKCKCPAGGIVTVWAGGRDGNLISEYMSMWATARHTKLPAFASYCHLAALARSFRRLSVPSLAQVRHCRPRWMSVVDNVNAWHDMSQSIILPVYVLLPDIIYPYLKEARKELTFTRILRSQSQQLLHNLSASHKKQPMFIGVHVRRTDYKRYLRRILNVSLAPISFFLTAMEHFQSKYPNSLFVVVSDEPDWCEENLVLNRSNVKVVSYRYNFSSDPAKLDLAVLAACNHTVFDYGTYGFWGAILAGGETIVYNISMERSSVKMANLLPNWIIMS